MGTNRKPERGIALIMALFVLTILSAIGLALMYMSNTETSINSNFRAGQQAYYASKAGLEEGRERLRYNAPGAINAPTVMPSTATTAGVIYITNPAAGETVTPWNTTNPQYFDDELCHENFPGLGTGYQGNTADVPCTVPPTGGAYYTQINSTDAGRGTQAAIPYKWVRITLKQVGTAAPYCTDGACTSGTAATPVCAVTTETSIFPYEVPLPAGFANCNAANMRPVYILTSLAVSPTGSRRMTQYEAASLALPPLPGSITFDGANPIFNAPTSNATFVNGNDHCGAQAPRPAVGAFDNASQTTLIADAIARANNYSGAGGTPSVLNVNSTLGPLATVGGLQTLVSNVTAMADQVYGNNPTGINLGTDTDPRVTVIQGDYNLGNSPGAGILLVEGTLSMSGNPNWNGAILVIGKGDIEKTGGGNGIVNGAIFMANLYNSSGQPLPTTSAPGVSVFNWSGGGNATINYDSCWINKVSDRPALKVLSSREEMY